MDQIRLSGLEFFGRHGCLPFEREKGQRFVADIILHMDLSKAGTSDNLEDTCDYSRVYDIVQSVVEGEPKKLIEAVAEEIAAKLLESNQGIKSVSVTLHKPEAPLSHKFDDLAVVIERKKDARIS